MITIKKPQIKSLPISTDNLISTKKINKKCVSRCTDDNHAQLFGDGHHKFYLEFRCNRPCSENNDVCIQCSQKKLTTNQCLRSFNHGNVNEPIPYQSHIFGGKWYLEHVEKWGQPIIQTIDFAIQYQNEARHGFIIPYTESPSKAIDISISQEMPRKKAQETEQNTEVKTTRMRKPSIIKNKTKITPTLSSDLFTLSEITPTSTPPIIISTPINHQVIEEKEPPKKRGPPRRKTQPSPYETLANTPKLVYKEITVPTHLEKTVEEFPIDQYEIEYVKLTPFQLGQTSYFRDTTKNKLYRKRKEKEIGEYIGRYDPITETIQTDIPDSDNES
jgi:hypothetical protein